MVVVEHREVVHSCLRISSAPFNVGQTAIEVLEGGRGAETLVGPSVSQPTVSQINETTLLHMIKKTLIRLMSGLPGPILSLACIMSFISPIHSIGKLLLFITKFSTCDHMVFVFR
jgi:hypothetical protein